MQLICDFKLNPTFKNISTPIKNSFMMTFLIEIIFFFKKSGGYFNTCTKYIYILFQSKPRVVVLLKNFGKI